MQRAYGTPILQVVSGSRASGTHTDDSDTDLMGVFIAPMSDILTFGPKIKSTQFKLNQCGKEFDVTWWELGHAFSILLKGNFNALPLLYSPHIEYINHLEGQDLRDRRHIFITMQLIYSIKGYAHREISNFKEGRKIKNSNPYKALACVFRELMFARRLLNSPLRDFNLQFSETCVKRFLDIKNKELPDKEILELLDSLYEDLKFLMEINPFDLPEKPNQIQAKALLQSLREQEPIFVEASPKWTQVKTGTSNIESQL